MNLVCRDLQLQFFAQNAQKYYFFQSDLKLTKEKERYFALGQQYYQNKCLLTIS